MKIPQTLSEAIIALPRFLSQEEIEFFESASEKDISKLHHTLGRFLRNEWGLWSSSALAKDLKDNHGINHPDDMSHAIMMAYINSLVK